MNSDIKSRDKHLLQHVVLKYNIQSITLTTEIKSINEGGLTLIIIFIYSLNSHAVKISANIKKILESVDS